MRRVRRSVLKTEHSEQKFKNDFLAWKKKTIYLDESKFFFKDNL